MKILFIIGLLFWIGNNASSLTDEKAEDILETIHDTREYILDGYSLLEEKAREGRELIEQSQLRKLQGQLQEQRQAQIQVEQPRAGAHIAQPHLVTQSLCLPYAELMAQLENQYHETAMFAGQGTDGRKIEFMKSHSKTFSIVSTDSNGTACLLASGNLFPDAYVMLTPR